MKTAEDILNEKGSYIISVSPEASIHQALQIMQKNNIGAMLVKDHDQYVGIWTERDLVRNLLSDNFNVKTVRIGDYMTTGPISIPHDACIFEMADKFIGRHIRHLLVTRKDQFIGLVSVNDLIKSSLREKAKKLEELNAIVHLEFYEEWRWNKKRK